MVSDRLEKFGRWFNWGGPFPGNANKHLSTLFNHAETTWPESIQEVCYYLMLSLLLAEFFKDHIVVRWLLVGSCGLNANDHESVIADLGHYLYIISGSIGRPPTALRGI